MNKIRVAHFCKSISYSGTDRVAQTFCKYLDKDKFDVYYLYNNSASSDRLQIVQNFLGQDKVVEIDHEDFIGPPPPYYPKKSSFYDVVKSLNLDILHLHWAGGPGMIWPVMPRIKEVTKKLVCTNIFGYSSPMDHLIDKNLFICKYIWCQAGLPTTKCDILNNPIEVPSTQEDLREELGLSKDEIVLGRIGRADNFCPISLNALKLLKDKYGLTPKYLIVNPCKNWQRVAENLDVVDQCVFLDPIYDDVKLSKFYNTIDILAHARSDGEVDSVTIGQAFMHGKPVISHKSGGFNGQVDQIGDRRGFVAESTHADEEYSKYLWALIYSNELRLGQGREAKSYAMDKLEASLITKNLENIYLSLF